ncbi:MAG: type II and III secretion system protein family protein [Planctomycetaceae bacterium]
MFKNGSLQAGIQRRQSLSDFLKRSGWRAATVAALWGMTSTTSAQTMMTGPALGGGGESAPLQAMSAEQPQMFPSVLTPGTGIPQSQPVLQIQPVQHSRRGPNPALDQHIESMPNEFKDMEVIHHRSQLVYTRQKVRRFAITDPSVIEIVQYSPTEFAIIGNTRGTTDLMMWFENEDQPLMYLVTVIPDPSIEERRRIDYGKIERKLALLYPNSKVYLIPLSRKVIVRGQAKDSEEAARILQIVRNEVYTQDGSLFGGFAGGAGGDTGYAGGYDPSVSGSSGRLDPANSGGLSSLIVNELHVPGEFQIMVQVRIAELNRSMLRELGINWNSLVEISGDQLQFGSNLGGGNVLTFSGIFEDFTINTLIRALASNGTVKIMEDVRVTTMAGQPAAFLSGGEFAVPTTVGLGGVGVGTTTFRGFGTSVIVTPTVVDNDLLRLQIVPELSQISGQAVGGVPSLNVKRFQGQVELREGQTIVLGGLFERQTQVEQTRVPLLGEVPIIGTFFFHSKKATEDEKELLIVVTPEIVRPLDADQTPPLPGWYVTHPDAIDFYKLNRTEGNPDLGHYQLLPFGNGQGYAQDVGYNFYNPAPADGQMSPMVTGGAYGGMNTPGYGGYDMGGGYPTTYPQSPVQGTQLMPQPQYGTLPSPSMAPIYSPEPTPIMSPTAYSGQPQAYGHYPGYGVQQTSGVAPQRPNMMRR